jgi:hypothetical protein
MVPMNRLPPRPQRPNKNNHWLPYVTELVNAVPHAAYHANHTPVPALAAAANAAQEDDISKLCQTLTNLRAVHAQAVVAVFQTYPEGHDSIDLGQHGELMIAQDASATLCITQPAARPASP